MHVNNDATFLYTSWSLGHCQNYLEQVTFLPYTVESTILVLKKKKSGALESWAWSYYFF